MEHTSFPPNPQNPPNPYQYQTLYYPQYTDPTHIQQPVIDPYNPGAQYGYTYQQTVYYQTPNHYAINTNSVQTADGSLAGSSTYYQTPGGVMANGSVSANQYAVTTNTRGVNPGTYQTNQPQNRGKWKKAPKTTKVVQSAWCDICHITCDTNDVFELHKQGKKHKKNLEKLRNAAANAATTSSTAPGLVVTGIPMIGPQENPNKASKASKKKKRSKASESLENLEAKKQKVLEGGAAADSVRTCSVCNVVCNSDTVYSFHLAGQKHAAMVRKHASLTTAVV
ncbi:hypothetical protein Leryth_020960 [Lithospermum erythrorhizon]|nr:hypothetical protein Leryth_020960 [Lithospermum erythrorhizon]